MLNGVNAIIVLQNSLPWQNVFCISWSTSFPMKSTIAINFKASANDSQDNVTGSVNRQNVLHVVAILFVG